MTTAPPSGQRPLPYSPLYFLAALGNGGLAVSFFIYLMFLVPYSGTPIPTWDSWTAAFSGEDGSVTLLAAAALVGVIVFTIRHIHSLIWNLRQYRAFRHTEAYTALLRGNAEVQLMAIPLTLTMTVNVGFVVGALFVPGLWNVVEWLFPLALTAFTAIAVYGLRLFLSYMGRLVAEGRFNWATNNSLSQLLAIFALVMIAVGFAAPAAMSHTTATAAIGLFGAIFFLSAAGLFAVIKLVLGFRDMFERGVSADGAPSLWIVIPILTVSGIAVRRLVHGLGHLFPHPVQQGDGLVFMTVFLSLQILFALLGWVVMRRIGYFETYLRGPGLSASSYALICPGVAMMVFGMFFLHAGLVSAGLVTVGSLVYFLLLAPLVAIQILTIAVMLVLDRRHFGRRKS